MKIKSVAEIFDNWNETLIWSCLQGVMGDIYTNVSGASSFWNVWKKDYIQVGMHRICGL